MRTYERKEAIRLRREEGKSVREIATLLGVARSSVSRWVRDVELSYEQRAALAGRNPALNPEFNGSRMQAQRALETRRRHQETPDRLGKSRVNTYSRSSKRLRRNVLPYGTCRIVVSRVAVIQAIYGALQELGRLERPEWAEN